ncbi:MAG: chemotaxis protein CheA [Spirochaetia bacterium]|nr:chemotaxis protein CheA [Spirochaetia bacterium]
MSDYLDPNNEELLKDFFIEAEMQVDALEQNILVLENDPSDHDAIDEIFRAAHTLKGAAATVQMTKMSEFTHLVEDVLDAIRSNEVHAGEQVVDILLNSIDVIKGMLSAQKEGSSYDEDISDLQSKLRSLLQSGTVAPQSGGKPIAAQPAPAAQATAAGSGESTLSEYDLLELKAAAETGETVYQVMVEFNEDHPMNSIGGIQVFAAMKDIGTVLKTVPEFEKLYEDQFFPVVYYYVSTDSPVDAIERKVHIPDVVSDTQITTVDQIAAGAVEKQPEPFQKAPAQAATREAEAQPSQPAQAAQAAAPEEHTSEEEAPAAKAEPKPSKEHELRKSGGSGSVLRVDSKRIDNLLNMVSEAVITKATFNQISSKFVDAQGELSSVKSVYYEKLRELFDSLPMYLERIQEGTSVKKIKAEVIERFGDLYTMYDSFETRFKNTVNEFNSTAQNLSRNTSDLQEGVMQIRMVPISQIFNRFPRLVRDVSKEIGKNVKLEIEGEDTELDKSVIEDLLDPLIHCVRNSIDHGVESPEERKAAGKTVDGHVMLKASNEGNMIIIEVEDDGKGIDVESVHKKAVDRGLIHPNKKLTEIEAFNLIFEPGFSTAKQVTNLSGRGVGLDVVKKQIEKLNGNVSVWSEKGEGSRITIKIPLTLAIIQGLLIRVGEEIYAIPITSVVDSHRINSGDVKMIDNYEVFNVREDVVSLLRLSRLFGVPSNDQKETQYVVIVGSGEKKMGLMVDSLIGEEDVVIKPLKDKYTNIPGIAGATILGDGTVALIIDVSQLLDLGLRREIENRKRRSTQIT